MWFAVVVLYAEQYRYNDEDLAPCPVLVMLSTDCEVIPFHFLKTDQLELLPFVSKAAPLPEGVHPQHGMSFFNIIAICLSCLSTQPIFVVVFFTRSVCRLVQGCLFFAGLFKWHRKNYISLCPLGMYWYPVSTFSHYSCRYILLAMFFVDSTTPSTSAARDTPVPFVAELQPKPLQGSLHYI